MMFIYCILKKLKLMKNLTTFFSIYQQISLPRADPVVTALVLHTRNGAVAVLVKLEGEEELL